MKDVNLKYHRFLPGLLLSILIITQSSIFAQPNIYMETVVATGLNAPIQITHAADGSDRIFVAERAGVIKVFSAAYVQLGVYLDLSSRVDAGGEGGLLSIAFHPDFETNGCLFVHFTDTNDNIKVSRYQTVTPSANTMTSTDYLDILSIAHPANNHFGGEMHFGADDNLYISIGDGGGSNDLNNNAQNLNVLLGKMLRITVATSGTGKYTIPLNNPFRVSSDINTNRNLICALGLRNPFRWSFDRSNGDMWIGDVGQGGEEEVNFCASNAVLGVNYAWRCYEGSVRTPAYNNDDHSIECAGYPNFVPLHVYVRSSPGDPVSVVGGVIYRGIKYPDMQGYYIGSDYYTGQFHVVAPLDISLSNDILTTPKAGITDFGESEDGDVFAVVMGENAIYRFVDANVEPLPVTLMNFTASKSVEGTVLRWTTSSEENFRQFDIEHSFNAKQFEKIGSVVSLNMQNGSAYRFTHARNQLGAAYYRLKLLDMDETFGYSKIITVAADAQETAFVRPSVVTNGTLNLELASGFHSVELLNISGSPILKKNIVGKTGMTGVSVNAVSGGLYIVRLTANDKSTIQQKVLIVP